jgi:hypothetical protein
MSGNRKGKDLADLSFLIPSEDDEVPVDDETLKRPDDTFAEILKDDYADAKDSETVGAVEDDYSEMDDFEDDWTEGDGVPSPSEEETTDDFGDDAGWKSDGEEDTLSFEASWFVSDDETSSAEDEGLDGPEGSESYDLDDSKFASLEVNDNDDSIEDIFETMKRIDIALPDIEAESGDVDDLPLLHVSQSYLGPDHGSLTDARFFQGTPIGVGEQLYILGADCRFHAVLDSQEGPLEADSIAWYKDTIFIGTARRGVLVTHDMGRTLTPSNSWYTEGFIQRGAVSAECSTSFTVFGHFHPVRFCLIGRTGEGQLLVSEDFGASWRGLMLKGCCAPIAVSTYSTGIFALTSDLSDTVSLYKSVDLEKWDNVPLPSKLSRLLSPLNGIVAAARKSVAVAAKYTRSLYLSVDSGIHFTEIRCPAEITAILLNRESPDFIAVGVTSTDGCAHVLTTVDRGRTWSIALSVEPSGIHDKVEFSSLCANLGQDLRILTVSTVGAHLISFPIEETKH